VLLCFRHPLLQVTLLLLRLRLQLLLLLASLYSNNRAIAPVQLLWPLLEPRRPPLLQCLAQRLAPRRLPLLLLLLLLHPPFRRACLVQQHPSRVTGLQLGRRRRWGGGSPAAEAEELRGAGE
jgi:hypothetical protein